MLIIQACSS